MATLAVRIDPDVSGARVVRRSLDDIKRAARDTEGATTRLGRSANDNFRTMGREISVADRALGTFGRTARTVGVALAAAMAGIMGGQAIGRMVNQYASLTNTLRVVAGAQGDVNQTMQDLNAIAGRTRTPMEAIASLYQRASIAANELGADQQELLRFTENVGLALAQQGGSAAQASGALLQLSQSLGAGVVRAEEFNSILEGAFPIAQAAARGIDEAGGSVARLRQMIIDGEVTSREFFNAILSQTDELTAAFANTTPTVEQAFTVLGNNLMMTVGMMDQASGASSGLANAIIGIAEAILGAAEPLSAFAKAVADNFERVLYWAGAVATFMSARWVAAFVSARVATFTLVGALTALRGAMVRTGIGIAVVAAGELAYQFMGLVERTGSFSGAVARLGSVGAQVWESLQIGASGMGDILVSVAARVEAAFLTAFKNILTALSNMLVSISNSLEGTMLAPMQGAIGGVVAEISAGMYFDIDPAIAEKNATANEKWAEGVEKLRTALSGAEEAAAGLGAGSESAAEGITAVNDNAPGMNSLSGAVGGVGSSLEDVADSAGSAAGGISEAERALEEFISTADRLAEEMFPGEYARREAEDLAASLATYGDALDDFQRQAVEARIADQYEAAKLGVRELEDETKDASKEMGDSLWDNFGSILADLFSGPIEDADEFFEKIMSGFAQIGQQNLSRGLDSLFGGGNGAPTAANDNGGGNWLDSLFGGVKDGAREGTAEGSASGIMGALGSGGASSTLGTLAGAAAGGYGMGYQTQSPMMGAAGGALQGFMAGGGFTPMGLLGGAIGGIMGFLGGMQGAAKALKEAQEKLDSLRNEIDQFVAAANGEVISQYASALDDARQKAKEYIELAKKAEDFDLVADIEKAMVNLPQTLAREFQKDLTASINSLRGLDYLNEVVSAQDQYNERLADAEKFGMDTADAFLELRLSMQEMADGSNVAQAELDSLAQRFPKLADALANIIPTGALEADLETAMDALNDRQSDLRAAYNDQSSTLGSLISQLERAQRSIREFRASLMIDDLTPLGQRDQVEAARQQFEDVAARVANGDVDALEELTGVSRDYLNEARDYYASSEAYAQIWEEVNRTLAEAESIAGRQLTEAQQQQAALDRQVGLLIDINDSVMSVSDAVAALAVAQQAAQKAQSAAVDSIYEKALGRAPDKGGRDFYEDLLGSGSSVGDIAGQIVNSREGKIAQMYRDIFGRNPDAAGLDYYMGSGQSLDTIRQHLEFAKANGAFQSGGFTGMGGVSDIAGVVHGQEYVVSAPSTRSIGPQNLDYMNRTGRMPGNDNSDVVAELRQTNQKVDRLTATIERMGTIIGLSDEETRELIREGNETQADVASELRKRNAA